MMTESSHHVAFTKCMIFLRGRRQWPQAIRMCFLGAHPVAEDRKSEIALALGRELKMVHWDVSW